MSTGHAIYEDDYKEKNLHAKLFHTADTCQTLVYVIDSAHSSASLLSLICGNVVKAFNPLVPNDWFTGQYCATTECQMTGLLVTSIEVII